MGLPDCPPNSDFVLQHRAPDVESRAPCVWTGRGGGAPTRTDNTRLHGNLCKMTRKSRQLLIGGGGSYQGGCCRWRTSQGVPAVCRAHPRPEKQRPPGRKQEPINGGVLWLWVRWRTVAVSERHSKTSSSASTIRRCSSGLQSWGVGRCNKNMRRACMCCAREDGVTGISHCGRACASVLQRHVQRRVAISAQPCSASHAPG